MILFRRLPGLVLMFPAAAVAQQAAPTLTPSPTSAASPSASALPVPAAPRGLPGAVPTPAAPIGLPTASPTATPVPTPTVAPTPIARPTATPTPTPSARSTPAPRRGQEPTPAAAPTSAAAPVAVPAQPTPLPAPSSTPAPISPTADTGGGGLPWVAIAGGLIVLALAVAGLLFSRRRRDADEPGYAADEATPLVPATPVGKEPARPAVPIPAAAVPTEPLTSAHPALTIEFQPARAGVNLLSAMVEGEATITNIGSVLLYDVRVEIRLIGAHAGQDAELAAMAAEPVTRPSVAPFVLEPGAFVKLSAVATLPRAAIVPLDAGGRPIFVPIVMVKLDGATDGASLRQAAAYAVGVERVDSARLAPFRLDGPPRTFDTVAARLHPIGLRRTTGS